MLAKLGHDLRNPVGTMVFLTEVLMNQIGDRASVQERQMFKDILHIGQKALQLTDDLVELSAGRNRPMRLHLEDVDVDRLLDRSISAQRPAADSKQVCLITHSLFEVPPLKLDAVKMLRALNEIIANAIHSSAPGSAVHIRMRTAGPRLEILVHDHAPAMTPDQVKTLFSPCSQDAATGISNGLGLAMARVIVKAHGGRIRVVSKPDWGNRFIISLMR